MKTLSEFSLDGGGDFLVLWEDGERVFCRERRPDADDSRSAVLILRPIAEHPTPATLDRLAHEYGLRNHLDDAWAVKPLELRRESGRTALVFKDPGGEPLERLLGAPMDIGHFFCLTIGIARALGRLHQRGLVHKDLKPTHILVNCTDGQVRITGLGLASSLPRERQAPEPPETITGTLAYMAPEQTGRMNRSIDSRSDLYALGVLFYQMLTGHLPFMATDPMEWIHCHIARKPVPPRERLENIPAPISQIVMKLLAKTAEERYQTAAGVEGDLQRCLAEWEAHRRIDDFALGQYDTPDQLLIPEKLYDRTREVEILLATFDRVTNGATEFVLVSGYPGIGKSSVVHEWHKVLVRPRGLFASGKFDQYKRNIPYSTLVQAFQSLVRPLLGKSDAELARWRDALLEALGPNGRLMVDLVPELKLIVGEQPPLPELSPHDAQTRFQFVFQRFIGVFARPEHPLALFLDDLQWIDAATLDFLEILLTQSDVRHLLLIGAYRDNEVDDVHPLKRKIHSIKGAGRKIEEITLAPLNREHVGQLIAEALRCEPARAAPLAQLVHEKAAGNPFFVIQFLYALTEEGLLTFDPDLACWSWDINRIHAKGYTDNVVELMVGKLNRLSTETQNALQQLACVGNAAGVTMLSIVLGTSEERVHAALREAVRLDLVERLAGSYRFMHDRVREAAYALTPSDDRSAAQLRIGRLLLSQMSPEEVRDNIFELASHLNAGTANIAEEDERDQVAGLNLLAGQKAKAATAYASASRYLSTGMELLDAAGWDRRYELAFALWIEAAECEYLNGTLDRAERLLSELLAHARSKLDRAAAYRLQVIFHVTNSAYQAAIDCGLECLRLFDIVVPRHPAPEEIETEYKRFWKGLADRSIESLIELPLMTDSEHRAAAAVLTFLFAPTSFTNSSLFYMLIYRGANLTLDHGVSEAAPHIYSGMAQILGPIFHRYEDGFRFASLSYHLAEKHGFSAAKAHFAMQNATPWCRPIQTAVDYSRRGYRVAVDCGDLTYACYFSFRLVNYLLSHGSPLEMVWSQSREGMDLAKRIKFRDVADIMASQQAFIANMRGETTAFSSFDSCVFDEAAFEAGLTDERMPVMVCWYWILKLEARFIYGNFAAARVAARQARPLISASKPFFQWANYVYFDALSIAAQLDREHSDTQAAEMGELREHLAQLQEWADACPTTFIDRYALVAAEIARLEGRELQAMHLYEEAVRTARDNGLVQNEAIAYERASAFYRTRGFDGFADLYLRHARYSYLRWGADGKVRQLDEIYPHLRNNDESMPGSTSTIGAPVEYLDLSTVIKVSQAISSEMVLEKLIETLMRTAIAQAGAERGLLILSRRVGLRIVAEATTGGDRILVQLHDTPPVATVLPESLLHYTLRTGESVILDDAIIQSAFAADPYVQQHQARSILFLPLVNQAKLIGVLYLENNLAPRVFAPARIAVLKLLASQAAISLENTGLYRDLAEREAKIRRLVDANIIGIFLFTLGGQIVEANDAFLHVVGYEREDLVSGRLRWTDLTPPEWRESDDRAFVDIMRTGTAHPYEKEYLRKDGRRVPVLIGGATFEEGGNNGVAFVLDLTERKRVEAEARENEQRYREMQTELAHANRVATMGQLTASIAHEVSQPIAAAVIDAQSALRWLGGHPPELEKVQQALTRVVKDGNRAAQVIDRIRALIKKAPQRKDHLLINDLILEVVALTRSEAVKNDVSVRTQLAEDVPHVGGDRVQLQQVILNLVLNAIEATSGSDAARELVISTMKAASGAVLIAVSDSGPGLAPENLERIFAAFYTTKPSGLGLGLSICRSIVEAHGGRLWASANTPRGAIFQFTVPAQPNSTLIAP